MFNLNIKYANRKKPIVVLSFLCCSYSLICIVITFHRKFAFSVSYYGDCHRLSLPKVSYSIGDMLWDFRENSARHPPPILDLVLRLIYLPLCWLPSKLALRHIGESFRPSVAIHSDCVLATLNQLYSRIALPPG